MKAADKLIKKIHALKKDYEFDSYYFIEGVIDADVVEDEIRSVLPEMLTEYTAWLIGEDESSDRVASRVATYLKLQK